MATLTPDPQVREALVAFQQYLSDNMAPLVAADSVALLIKQPPQLVAQEIRAWIAAQYRATGASVPISDYLFHAMKKIHVMGQFKLLPEKPLTAYLEDLAQIILEYCPEEDRELLRTNLGLLSETETVQMSAVPFVHRQMGTEKPLASQARTSAAPDEVLQEVARSNRQLALLLERMEREPMLGPGRSELSSQIFSIAADSSETNEEFRRYLEQFGHFGVESQTDKIFRTLGQSVPDWVAPVSPDDSDTGKPSYQSESVEAMHKIITLAEDAREGAKRLRELVHTAVEHVNEGSLARAVTMLELADRIIAERQLDAESVEGIQKAGLKILDLNQLRKYVENHAEHPLLKRILNFFPEYRPQGILDSLQVEQKRDRRRLLLELMEVHGKAARTAVFENLEAFLRGAGAQGSWYFPRNLVYLLRRVPRPEDVLLEAEIDAVGRLAQPAYPVPIVREAVAYLGQRKHARSEQALIAAVKTLEELLTRPGQSVEDTKKWISHLDRAIASLARCGTANAPRVVVDHALKRDARFGDSMSRLSNLAGQDLSGDKETVDRLVKAIKSELPVKVLGFVMQKSSQDLVSLIEALSTTPAPEVRQIFEEIVRKFPGRDFTKLAVKALDGFDVGGWSAEAPSTNLAGNLDVFGLPSLLQRLSESRVTGALNLKDEKGRLLGSISLDKGLFKDSQAGMLRGEDAIFQLFEKPVAGTFEFISPPAPASESHTAEGLEVIPLIIEGMRRYDGYMRARVLVPDQTSYRPAETEPTAHPDDHDESLFRELWEKASAGATALECEEAIRTDPYRIRRLMAHWVEQGVLQPK